MNPETLVVVHAYAGDADRVEAFLPSFLHHGCPVLVLSPEDAPVEVRRHRVETASAGKAGWKGQQTLERQVAHWRLALERPASWFLLNDADSLCLTPDLPEYLYSDPGKFWSNVLCHEWEHQEDDHPNFNPPYFVGRPVLEALVAEAATLEIPAEADLEPHDWGQAIDGFYTYLIMNRLGVPWENYPDGATTWPRGLGEMLEAVRTRGARLLHGLKEATHLAMLKLAYSGWEWEQRHPDVEGGAGGPLAVGETIVV